MTRTSLLLALLLSCAMPVLAQSVPFDMTPESDLRVEPQVPATPAATPTAPTPAVLVPQRLEHFILPAPVRLKGEQDRAATVVYLTEAQAAAPARLQLAYLNALVVAPEFSALTIRVNNGEVLRAPLSASAAPGPLAIDLPAGLLRQGPNTIEFLADQRHRTDCTIGSTYELWTEIASDSAILSFEGAGLGQVHQLSDLAAIGVDADGATTIRLLAPALGQPDATRAATLLAQHLALAMRVPDLRVENASEPSAVAAPGILDVVLATADQLPPAFAQLQAQAASGPIAVLAPLENGANTLVVSGPDWSSVARATDAIALAAPVSADRPRIDLPSANPLLSGGEVIALADLGMPTAEFNGRRLTTGFQFTLPPDFYANSYGEAELVLDAAYSADVLPGSEIDIYTNAQIASATPLLRTDGGQLRDTVIRFPMTNLRPGRNEIQVVVNLNTQSDAVCSPGWTGEAPVRFVFSSGSQLRIPDYARAAALPDLQLLTGSAWPYSQEPDVPIAVGSGMDSTLATLTLMARVASASEQVLPVSIVPEAQLPPERNAILVMPVSEMSSASLNRSGLAPGAVGGGSGADVLDQFVSGSGQPDQLSGFAERVLQTVGLTLDDLRFLPQRDPLYQVPAGGVVMAQSVQPEGGLWTVLSGTDSAGMRTGMDRMAVTAQWRQVDGRVSALAPNATQVTSVETVAPVLVQTQPLSFTNIRLVAANWFSGNILVFSAILGAVAIFLMVSTAMVLRRVGRP